MYVQGVVNVYDLDWNGAEGAAKVPYGDVFKQAEREFSAFNFEFADTDILLRHLADAEKECEAWLDCAPVLPLPAYDQCMKSSHLFNLLDARGVISVTQRATYIGRVRTMSKACCEAWLASEESGAPGDG